MKLLVLGTGGREHALAWKLLQSPLCESLYFHPGNPGAMACGVKPLPDFSDLADLAGLTSKVKQLGIDLVVIGPESLLAIGCADFLRKAGLNVVGPNKLEAQLESSKIFAKEFMTKARIPTASHFIAEDDRDLFGLLADRRTYPLVLKLDGLASGKGVVVASSVKDVESFIDRIWIKKEFGAGPHRVLVEEFIEGKELSYIGLCDSLNFIPLSSANDYKRAGNQNTGPNTGGMGSVSPSNILTDELESKIESRITIPLLKQMQKDGFDYRGALYIGLMIDHNNDPYVLEFNARFGDPETQALMLRLDSDLVDLLQHTATATLSQISKPKWKPETSLYVVAAAEGYPESPRKGDAISGLETLDNQVQVFFSGVSIDNGSLYTNGGRVLGLGTLASNRQEARDRIYKNLQRVHWKGIQYRDDIGL